MSRAQPPLALTLPLAGNRVIEASAGTGKTWTLSALYLRLVLGRCGDPEAGVGGPATPLAPQQILVLTFTNAAAEELRDRIRARLALAARAFADGEGHSIASCDDVVVERLYLETPLDERARAGRLLARAAESMDEAAIGTIHSWALQTLQSNPFRSCIPFEVEMVDGREQIEHAARDYFRVHLERLAPPVYALVARALGTPQQIAGLLGRLLDRPARIRGADRGPGGDAFAAAAALAARIDAAKARWRDGRDEAAALLRAKAAQGALQRTRPDKLKRILEAFDAWAEGDSPLGSTAMFTKVDGTQRLWFAADTLAQRMNNGHAPPRHAVFDALEEAVDVVLLQSPLPADEVRALRAHAWHWIGQRLDAERRLHGRWSFRDLLAGLDEALADPRNGEDFAALLRDQFPAALVDEFQDTDALQYAVFSRLYLDAARAPRPGLALLLIGDPKQAIYRFRGADLETYLAARRDAGPRVHRLDTNFRSTRELVAAVNAVFAHAAHPDGPFRDRRLAYVAAQANGRAVACTVAGRPLTALEFWRLPRAQRAVSNRQDAERLMAAHCAEEIAQLLIARQRGDCDIPAREIAVLVQNGPQAQLVRDELARRKVASVYLSMRDSVFETAQAKDLLIILRAVAQPSDDRMVRSALATRSMGYPLDELDRCAGDEDAWEQIVAQMVALGEVWSQRGVLPMLRRLMSQFGVFHQVRETIDGERALTNLLHLGELLQAESRAIHGREGLIRFLAEAIDEAGAAAAPSDERLQRLESDESLVRVLTVHKSKGLEYDLVYLPFGVVSGRGRRLDAGSIAFVHEDGELVADLAADDATLARERDADHQEALRLLYVAVTRARHSCRVGVADWKLGEDQRDAVAVALASDDDDEVTARLAALAAADPTSIRIVELGERAALSRLYAAGDRAAVRPARRFLRPARGDLERHWRIASYSALTRDDGPSAAAVAYVRERELEEELTAAPEAAGAGLYGFPRGAEPGNFLHGIMEWIALRLGFDQALQRPDLLAEVRRRCRHQGLGEWAEVLTDRLLAALRQPILPSGCRLGDLPRTATRAEIDFLLPVVRMSTRELDERVCRLELPGQERPRLAAQTVRGMLRGFIDLVFEHDGRFWVADYKSNHLGDGLADYGPDALAGEILRHRYDLQYVLYTLALHRLLKTRLAHYDYDTHFGGVRYLFLRALPDGGGVYAARPARELIEGLEADCLGAVS